MSLFHNQEFTGHSGQLLRWKIECDALTRDDWEWAAARVAERVTFWRVHGVPRGGLPFARALRKHVQPDGRYFLMADDVLTTGGSLLEERSIWPMPVATLGVVLFARIPPPEPWIKALFVMPDWASAESGSQAPGHALG